ncbi:MAG: peptidoglycan DD-metalloendopeptidase family protein [Archangiaceae bacterium]|nr:peptidoglycan DD-metalloendopeptidase family protein [Archangiaceae bacterium]
MATDSASAAAAAAAAARAAAEARRRIEEAAREAARRAEEARKQAEQKPPPAPLKPPSLFNQKNVFQLAQKPKVDLNPPPTAPLSPNETRAYVSAAKAVTAKDPAANPHQVIAKSPELVSWIQSSSARLDQTLPTAQTDVNQQLAAELDSRLTVQNGAARLAAVAGADSGAITAPTAVTDAESAKAALTALSPKAKVKFSDGATGTDTVQGCAKALLASPNVKFWDDLSTGSDRKNLQRLADGEKSLVLADNAEHTGVAPNLKMMQALVAMSKAGPIQINALTGGNHSSGSNHYSGHAVDLDLNSGDAGQIEQIANRYGGTRNSESDHIHLDFLEGGSGPAATRVTATTGETNAGGSDKLIKPLDTPMPKSSEFDNPDGPEGMPGINGGTVHGALDWFAKGGTPVKAPVNGTVTEVTASKGNSGQVFGGVVKVKDDSGKLFVFRHLDPSGVSVGQKVKAGTELGKVTSWADSPSSSHCHMEIWKTESGGYNQANAIDPLKFYQKGVTGGSSDPGATPAGLLDAAALKKVMPKVDGKTAKEASPVVAQAIAAAGINDPKESAAFVAMVGQQTKQLSTPDAYQTVVDTATKWKADPSIGKAARKGDLNAVAKGLGIQVSKAQLDAGDKDQRVADRIDQIFAAANPEAASHKVKNEAGQLVTLGQLCVRGRPETPDGPVPLHGHRQAGDPVRHRRRGCGEDAGRLGLRLEPRRRLRHERPERADHQGRRDVRSPAQGERRQPLRPDGHTDRRRQRLHQRRHQRPARPGLGHRPQLVPGRHRQLPGAHQERRRPRPAAVRRKVLRQGARGVRRQRSERRGVAVGFGRRLEQRSRLERRRDQQQWRHHRQRAGARPDPAGQRRLGAADARARGDAAADQGARLRHRRAAAVGHLADAERQLRRHHQLAVERPRLRRVREEPAGHEELAPRQAGAQGDGGRVPLQEDEGQGHQGAEERRADRPRRQAAQRLARRVEGPRPQGRQGGHQPRRPGGAAARGGRPVG